jgi:hypothetical protein
VTYYSIQEIFTKMPNEIIKCAIDLTGRLASTEILAGTPTITSSSSGLTISSVSVSTIAGTIFGATVAASQSIVFLASSGTTNETYDLVLSTTTSGGQILNERFRMKVVE